MSACEGNTRRTTGQADETIIIDSDTEGEADDTEDDDNDAVLVTGATGGEDVVRLASNARTKATRRRDATPTPIRHNYRDSSLPLCDQARPDESEIGDPPHAPTRQSYATPAPFSTPSPRSTPSLIQGSGAVEPDDTDRAVRKALAALSLQKKTLEAQLLENKKKTEEVELMYDANQQLQESSYMMSGALQDDLGGNVSYKKRKSSDVETDESEPESSKRQKKRGESKDEHEHEHDKSKKSKGKEKEKESVNEHEHDKPKKNKKEKSKGKEREKVDEYEHDTSKKKKKNKSKEKTHEHAVENSDQSSSGPSQPQKSVTAHTVPASTPKCKVREWSGQRSLSDFEPSSELFIQSAHRIPNILAQKDSNQAISTSTKSKKLPRPPRMATRHPLIQDAAYNESARRREKQEKKEAEQASRCISKSKAESSVTPRMDYVMDGKSQKESNLGNVPVQKHVSQGSRDRALAKKKR